MNWRRLDTILIEEFGIDEILVNTLVESTVASEQLTLQTDKQPSLCRIIGQQLIAADIISEEQLAQALAIQTGSDFREKIDLASIDDELFDLVSISYAREQLMIPIEMNGKRLLIAIADPFDNNPINDLASKTGLRVESVVVPKPEILRLINQGYEKIAGGASSMVGDIDNKEEEGLSTNFEPADLLDVSDEAPIIRFVNSLLTQAYKERASDIHIEPFENELIVRYRIDGLLYEVVKPPLKAHASIVSRIKILSNLDIAEKRLPQDGRFRVRIAAKDLDLRVSTLPTAFGERVVLRLLDHGSSVLSLEEIGIDDTMLKNISQMINKNHGVFLVTGPTGSGKTTTLYAALQQLNSLEKNIITVEDPIEYQLSGVGQIQVNPKIDLTFANGLRSILRQDPDVIMIGEIRDGETAEIAVQSALTGHMVFSTLHTNDAAGAMTRLVEMGVEPFLTASAVVGVLAQRLVRKICPDCRTEYQPSTAVLEELSAPSDATFFRGEGCDSCMQIGYRGRTAIYELLTVDGKVRDLVLQSKDSGTIKDAAVAQGMLTLRDAGITLAQRGVTTVEEILRVTQEEG